MITWRMMLLAVALTIFPVLSDPELDLIHPCRTQILQIYEALGRR
jgi:hypothetical protein